MIDGFYPDYMLSFFVINDFGIIIYFHILVIAYFYPLARFVCFDCLSKKE